MKKGEEVLTFDNMFATLANNVASLIDGDTGSELNIIEFIKHEVNLGIDLTDQQKLVLKLVYGLPLSDQELSILEYWHALNKTTWNPGSEPSELQTLILEAGRRSGKCKNILNSCIFMENGLTYGYELIPGSAEMGISNNIELYTSDQGLLELSRSLEILGLKKETWISIDEIVAIEGRNKTAEAKNLYIKGVEKTLKFRTECGYNLEATPEHRIKVLDVEGNIVWRYLADLKVDDYICIHRAANLFPTQEVHVEEIVVNIPQTKVTEDLELPTWLTTDWGYLLGLAVANGSWTKRAGLELTFHKQDEMNYIKAVNLCGLRNNPVYYPSMNGARINISSRPLRLFLENLGYNSDSKPKTKKTPWSIRRAPKSVVAAYLSGLFDGDGSVEKGGKSITLSTASYTLANETQLLLLNFGIVSRVKEKIVKGKSYYILSLRGQKSVRKFIEEIGFRLDRKQNLVVENLNKVGRDGGDTERIPYQTKWLQRLRDCIPSNIGKQPGSVKNLADRGGWESQVNKTSRNLRQEFRSIVGNSLKTGTKENFSYYRMEDMLTYAEEHCSDAEAIEHFKYLAECNYFFDPVVSIENSEAFCIDLTVPGYEQYVANGMTNHNTVLASLICTYEFYQLTKLRNPQSRYGISTNTPISILVLATTADQAKRTIYRNIVGVIKNSPYFKNLIDRNLVFVGKEEIAYEEKLLYLQSGNSKSGAQVGGTLKCLVMDEVSRFTDADGDSNALTLWSNLGISCSPFKDQAKRIAISSAWYDGDAIEQLYLAAGKDPTALGLRMKSWEMNPIIAARDNPVVQSAYALDPIRAATEFEGIRPAYADAFLNADQIDKAFTLKDCIQAKTHIEAGLVYLDIVNIESAPGVESYIHVDPGITKDAYALAVGHAETIDKKLHIFIDSLLLWQPTFEADVAISNVGEVIKVISKSRYIAKVTADHYNSVETIQRLRQEGIRSEIVYFSNKQQLLMYDNLRQLLHEGRISIAKTSQWASIAIRELKQVQLINGRKIDHPRDGSKDLADAIAAVAYVLTEKSQGSVLIKSASFGTALSQKKEDQIITLNTSNSSNRDVVMGSLTERRNWQINELTKGVKNDLNRWY